MSFWYSWSTLLWYRCYYPHRSRDALSAVCKIFLHSSSFPTFQTNQKSLKPTKKTLTHLPQLPALPLCTVSPCLPVAAEEDDAICQLSENPVPETDFVRHCTQRRKYPILLKVRTHSSDRCHKSDTEEEALYSFIPVHPSSFSTVQPI